MSSLHYLLMKAHSVLKRRIVAGAQAIGLSSAQPKVLEFLLLYGENNQKAIAEHCEIEPATVGSILQRMERDGLISRSNHQGNRRSLYVALTPRGRAAAEEMAEVFRTQEDLAAAALTAEEREQLRMLLDKFCRSAQAKGGEQA